jgi:hypothetical protein
MARAERWTPITSVVMALGAITWLLAVAVVQALRGQKSRRTRE